MNKLINILPVILLTHTLSMTIQTSASNVVQNHCKISSSFQKSLYPQSRDLQSENHPFYVISGSFLIQKNAIKKVALLKKAGYLKTSIKIFPESEYYSIVVDSFSTETEAINLKENLAHQKFECFIKRLIP
ncbi:MAG: SPOR domain-containing protein [Saprospiraceae bacterium]|nr:SPOR domain-containing protein [Saprospiraceae bacterium]